MKGKLENGNPISVSGFQFLPWKARSIVDTGSQPNPPAPPPPGL
jgi:hypothetical protein